MRVLPICVNDDCWRHELSHSTGVETFERVPLIEYDNELVMRWHEAYGTQYSATEAAFETVIFEFSSRRIFRGSDTERI